MVKAIVFIFVIVACSQCDLSFGQAAQGRESMQPPQPPYLSIPENSTTEEPNSNNQRMTLSGSDMYPNPFGGAIKAAVIQGAGGTIKLDGVVVREFDTAFVGGSLNVRTDKDSIVINDTVIYRSNIARIQYPNMNLTRRFVSNFQVEVYRDPIIRYTDNLGAFVIAIVHGKEIENKQML